MKRVLLVLGFFCTALHLSAVSPVPYTEWVSFSANLSGGQGGGATLTVYGEGTATTGSNANAGESPLATAWLKPCQQYTFSYQGTLIGVYMGSNLYLFNATYKLSFTSLTKDYTLYINGVPADSYIGTINTTQYYNNAYSFNYSFTIELRPEANAARAEFGSFSGIDVGKSVTWEVGLGGLRAGQGAGRIIFKETDLTVHDPSARARLYYSAPANASQINTVIDAGGQTLHQVGVPQGVVNLVDDTGGYWLKFYDASALATWNGSIYTLSNMTPWRTIRVTGAVGGPLTITETEGSAVRVSTLTLTSGSVPSGNYVWTLQEGDGSNWLRTTTHTSTANGNDRDDIVAVRTGGTSGTVVAKTKFHYYNFTPGWGEDVTQVVADPDTPPANGGQLTTSYTYYTTSSAAGNYRQIQSVTDPTGRWVSYLYYDDWNRRSQVAVETRPWLNSPGTVQSAAGNVGNSVNHDYVADYTGRYRNESNTENRTTDIRTGRALTTPTLFQVRNNVSYTSFQTDAYASSSASQRTITEIIDPQGGAYTDFSSLPFAAKRPDQSQDSYVYYRGTFDYNAKTFTTDVNGSHFRTNVWHGSSSSTGADALTTWAGAAVSTIYLLPNKSTMEVVIQNPAGLVVRRETWVYTGSGNYSQINSADLTYDFAGRLTQVALNNGTTTTTVQNNYANGRLQSTIDATGAETDFTYDGIGRVATSVKKGAPSINAILTPAYSYQAQGDITTTLTYDGANHVTQQVASSGSLSLTTTRQFDLSGRQVQQVDPGNFTTNYAYTSGGQTVTVTFPGGATKTTQNYLDGQLQQVSGTAVVAQSLSYWVDAGTGNMARQLISGGVSAAWTNTYCDWLGRTVQEWRPQWDGNAWAKTWYFNTSGQLYQFTQPGAAALLYSYDTMGVLYRECVDVNGNGTIDLASTDRITQHDWSFTQNNGWWRHTVNSTYATASSGTPTTAGVTDVRLSGYSAGLLSQQKSYDQFNNVTTASTNLLASKVVATQVVAPDSTTAAEQVVYNGLPVEAQDTTGVIRRFQFDALGRKITDLDPRTGNTTTAYVSGTSLVSTVTDPAGVAQATYTYDAAGRVATVTNALSKVARYEYDTLGHKLHEFGDTAYPAEYVYDSCGRLTGLHTFRGGSGWTGTSWPSGTTGTADTTTWSFHAATGLPQSKTDAASHAVSFTYTVARQVQTRTWARGVVTTFGYDPATAELTGVTYSNDPAQTPALAFTYNRLGKAATVTDVTGTRTLTYNLAGTLELQNEDFAGYYGSGRRLTYPYDTTGNGTKGRPIGLQVGTAGNPTADQNVSYGYDAYGRFNGLTGGGQTFAYNYTANSHLISSVVDSGANYTDARGYNSQHDWFNQRTTSIGTATKAAFAYTPDSMGRVTAVAKTGELFNVYGNTTQGLSTSYGYNDRSELTSESTCLGGTPPQPALAGRNDSYAYDSVGNRSSTTHNGQVANYTPNVLNQYQNRDVPGSFDVAGSGPAGDTITVGRPGERGDTAARNGPYFFDAYALSNTGAPVFTTLTIYDNGTPSATLPAFVARTQEQFGYDNDGNLTGDGRWNYTYDAENRLITMETNSAAVGAGVPRQKLTFTYDYANRRVSKEVQSGWNGSTYTSVDLWHRFLYNGTTLVAETDHNNGEVIVKNYFWGLDLSGTTQGAGGTGGLLLIQDGSNSYLPAHDAMGNVHGLLKASDGSLAACYEYDAFGKTLRESGPYATSNSIRYSTQYTDLETGLVYYGRRYYSPALGRFINRDPIEEAGGSNLYAFCGNNGVNGYDYLGMDQTPDRIIYGGSPPSGPPAWLPAFLSRMRGCDYSYGSGQLDALMYGGRRSLGDIGYMGMYLDKNGNLTSTPPAGQNPGSAGLIDRYFGYGSPLGSMGTKKPIDRSVDGHDYTVYPDGTIVRHTDKGDVAFNRNSEGGWTASYIVVFAGPNNESATRLDSLGLGSSKLATTAATAWDKSLADLMAGRKSPVFIVDAWYSQNKQLSDALLKLAGGDANRIIVATSMGRADSILSNRLADGSVTGIDIVGVFAHNQLGSGPEIWNSFGNTIGSFRQLGQLTSNSPLFLSICYGNTIDQISNIASAYGGAFYVSPYEIVPAVGKSSGNLYLYANGTTEQHIFEKIH